MRNISRKRVLLIATSFEDVSLITARNLDDKGLKLTDDSHYPLGIAYLHSYMESKGIEIKSLFLNNQDYQTCFETIVKELKEFPPSIVGLQLLTPNRVSSYRIIEYIHEHHPHIQIIKGGIHSTLLYQKLLDRYPYLIAVLGEGEVTFAELVHCLGDGGDLKTVDGIALVDDGVVVTTKARMLIENLDTLPFPKHELFFKSMRGSGNILTSRGCPFKCSFCALDSVSRRKVRTRSVGNVIEEIEHMVRSFPSMTNIIIHDDTFCLNNKWAIELCDEIIKRKFSIEFVCSSRVKPISLDLVKKMEEANFRMVMLGLESGDEGVLKAAHKNITQKNVINAIELFSQTSMEVYAFLIVGLPGETLETIRETARFIKKLQRIKYIYYDNVALLSVYPGTEIYEIAKSRGQIDDDYWFTDKPVPLFTAEHSQEELFRLKNHLLNHIELKRFFTPLGFRAQFTMVPSILGYYMSAKKVAQYMDKVILPLVPLLSSVLPASFLEAVRRWYGVIIRKLSRRV